MLSLSLSLILHILVSPQPKVPVWMGFSQDLPGHSWRSVEQAPFCLFDLCKKKNSLMKLVPLKNICRTGPPWKSRKQMYTEVWLLKLLLDKFLHQGRGILRCAWTHQSPAFYFTRPKLQGFMYKRAAKVWRVYNSKVATQKDASEHRKFPSWTRPVFEGLKKHPESKQHPARMFRKHKVSVLHPGNCLQWISEQRRQFVELALHHCHWAPS